MVFWLQFKTEVHKFSKNLEAIWQILGKTDADVSQILGVAVQNVVPSAICPPGFVHHIFQLSFFCTSIYSIYVWGIFVLETVYKIQGEKKREPFARYGKKKIFNADWPANKNNVCTVIRP